MKPQKLAAGKLICALILVAIAATGLGQSFQVASATVPPNVDLKDVRYIQRLGSQLPLDIPFKDQNGQDATLRTMLHGKPALILAIFYRCTGVCSLELDNLVGLLDKMKTKKVGRDFDVIVLGINPKETWDLAHAKFAQIMATSPDLKRTGAGWHLLTGKLDNIRAVTSPMGYFFTYDEGADRVNHPAGISFITPRGIVSSYILGAKFDVDAVSANLDLAGKNQVGVKSQDIFFGCICIDPLTGRRTIVVQNVLKVAGVVTLLAVSLMLLTLTGKARWAKKRASATDATDRYLG